LADEIGRRASYTQPLGLPESEDGRCEKASLPLTESSDAIRFSSWAGLTFSLRAAEPIWVPRSRSS